MFYIQSQMGKKFKKYNSIDNRDDAKKQFLAMIKHNKVQKLKQKIDLEME